MQAATGAGQAANRIAEASDGRPAGSAGLEIATKIFEAADTYDSDEPIQFNA